MKTFTFITNLRAFEVKGRNGKRGREIKEGRCREGRWRKGLVTPSSTLPNTKNVYLKRKKNRKENKNCKTMAKQQRKGQNISREVRRSY